ncbi:hypothetical protein ACWIWA_11255, partial [Ursidibacter arcticus]
FVFCLMFSLNAFASDNVDEIVKKFKPESQKIINSSNRLTMEKLAKILNIEAGDDLIGVKDGKYIVLKHVHFTKRSEVRNIDNSIVADIMMAKYRGDVKAIKYLDLSDAITNLYDDSRDYDHIKNIGK